ncbi:MAG: metallophosphoesterase [Sporomusaceae bacterium]|nr:metallophosphoesterase [Sporomusaceae bacterium]
MTQTPGPSYIFLLLFVSLPMVILAVNDLLCRKCWAEAYRPWRKAFWILSLLSFGMVFIPRALKVSSLAITPIFRMLLDGAYAVMIGQVFFTLFLGAVFLLTVMANRLSSSDSRSVGLSRRRFLGGAAGLLSLTSFGLAAKGVVDGETRLDVVKQQVKFAQLPTALAQFKIAQISDAHLGPFFPLEKLDEALALVKAQEPDLLVITGDLIDDLDLLTAAIAKLNALSPSIPQGIFFCWGNHEYFRNKPLIERAIRESRVTLLDNSSQLLLPGDIPVYLAGVDYPWGKTTADSDQIRQKDLEQALSKIPSGAFTILLAHHPDYFTEAFAAKVPLTLSGHTHGGQIAAFGRSLSPVQYKYMLGMYEDQGCYGYVSPGTGQWLPFRLGCPAEVTLFTFATK